MKKKLTYSEIKFKPEFEEKLKKLRIKRKFINNVSHQRGGKISPTVIELLNNHASWNSFITSAFLWPTNDDKKNNVEYWMNISNK